MSEEGIKGPKKTTGGKIVISAEDRFQKRREAATKSREGIVGMNLARRIIHRNEKEQISDREAFAAALDIVQQFGVTGALLQYEIDRHGKFGLKGHMDIDPARHKKNVHNNFPPEEILNILRRYKSEKKGNISGALLLAVAKEYLHLD